MSLRNRGRQLCLDGSKCASQKRNFTQFLASARLAHSTMANILSAFCNCSKRAVPRRRRRARRQAVFFPGPRWKRTKILNVPPQCFVPITDRNHQELLDELEWKYRRKREQDGGFEPERDAQKVKLGALFPLFFFRRKNLYILIDHRGWEPGEVWASRGRLQRPWPRQMSHRPIAI